MKEERRKAEGRKELPFQHFPISTKDIPDTWEIVPVGEIALEVAPGFPSGKHNKEGKGIPHLRPMNVSREGTIDLSEVKYVAVVPEYPLEADDVLFNNTNSPELVGKTGLIRSEHVGFAYSNHMTRIKAADGVEPGFLAKQLHFLWMSGYLRHRCTNHVNQASISSKTLADTVPVILPPHSEQVRIIGKLEELFSELDAGIAELQAAKAKLALYRKSLLKAAVEGKLTAAWREQRLREAEAGGSPLETGEQLLKRILEERRRRWEEKQLAKFEEQGKTPLKDWRKKYPEPIKPNVANLPKLPEGWIWVNLGLCFTVAVGATPSRKSYEYWGGDIPWVSSGEVNFSRIAFAREYITEQGLKNSSTQINPKGSVLLGMIGEGKTRGQVAILDVDAANNQNCAAIWVSETEIEPGYVYFWLWSQYNETRKGSSGNNQPALNKSLVEKLYMPLPPLEEGGKITELLKLGFNNIDEQEKAIDFALNQSAAQRQNILKAAFSGQLVPQDPTDEPASRLLDRIREARVSKTSPARRASKRESAEKTA